MHVWNIYVGRHLDSQNKLHVPADDRTENPSLYSRALYHVTIKAGLYRKAVQVYHIHVHMVVLDGTSSLLVILSQCFWWAPFKEEWARGTLWETWFMYTVFVKGILTISYMSLLSCLIVVFFFTFFLFNLSRSVIWNSFLDYSFC